MDYQQLLEVYFGENQNIKEMQNCITELRKIVRKNNNKFIALNTNKYVQKFNRLAEKEWGFKSFGLSITNSFVIDAYNLPVLYDYRMLTKKKKKNLLVSNGFKYKPEANYCACVYISRGLFTNENFTDREIFAVLLHEIGHNFSTAISDNVSILSFCKALTVVLECCLNFTRIFSVLITTNAGHEMNNYANSFINENFPKIKEFYEIAGSIFNFFITLSSEMYNKILFNIPNLTISVISTILPINIVHSIINTITGYRDEKIADSFTTIYGYGPETASIHRKFQRHRGDLIDVSRSAKLTPLFASIIGLCDALTRLIIAPLDEHPAEISRITEQSKYLKKELEKEDLDPKVKKEILKQIQEIDKVIKDVTNLKDKNKYNIFFNMINVMNMKLFKGDFRDKLYNRNSTYDDIERVYNRKMNESNNIFMDVFTSLDD